MIDSTNWLWNLATAICIHHADSIPARIAEHGNTVIASLSPGTAFDHLILCENLRDGQCIRHHTIRNAATGALIAEGHSIGSQRHRVSPRVEMDRIEIELADSHAQLNSVDALHTGIESIPEMELHPELMNEKVMTC